MPLTKVIFRSCRPDILEYTSKPMFVELLKSNLSQILLVVGNSCPRPSNKCEIIQSSNFPSDFFECLMVQELIPVCEGVLTLKTEVLVLGENQLYDRAKDFTAPTESPNSDKISLTNFISVPTKNRLVNLCDHDPSNFDLASTVVITKELSTKLCLLEGDYVNVHAASNDSSCLLQARLSSTANDVSVLPSISFKLKTDDLTKTTIEVQ